MNYPDLDPELKHNIAVHKPRGIKVREVPCSQEISIVSGSHWEPGSAMHQLHY